MNGTKDVRDAFKAAVGEQGRNFVRATSSTDAHKFFTYVSNYYFHKCKSRVRYSFKALGLNDQWSIEKLEHTLSKKGKYAFLAQRAKIMIHIRNSYAQ